MKVLLEERLLNQYNTRQLFTDVLRLFDEFNTKQFFAQEYLYKFSKDTTDLNSFISQNSKSDPTWKSLVIKDKFVKYVIDFERKMEFIKTQLTEDEFIIYKYSLEEREMDKVIRNRINKSEHKYYQIKKSCYLKIALLFRLVPSIEENSCLEITQMI